MEDTVVHRISKRTIALFATIFGLALLLALPVRDSNADEGGASWGYGKTYQNNWYTNCQWYDTQHDFGGPYGCYRGVWSDTEAYYGDGVSVYEYAQHQTYGICCGGQGVAVFYAFFGDYPVSDTDDEYASVNHYYCGEGSCGGWKVNVIGYAYHYGNGAGYIYTESMWGAEYHEP